MRNAVTLFRSETARLLSNAMTIIITIGLVIMPSLFAWYNVLACWNVFENTGNLKVAVANADEGYESDLMPLRINLGDQVIGALRANDQIDWIVTTENDAIDGARGGRYYAAVVIPKSFSRDMLSFYDDGAERANIVYYANQKLNAIAPKITGQGADTVSYQINKMFAETLSEAALGIAQGLARFADSENADTTIAALSTHIGESADRIDQAAAVLDAYSALIESSSELANSADELIGSAKNTAADAAQSAREESSSVVALVDALQSTGDQLVLAFEKAEAGFKAAKSDIDGLFDAAADGSHECADQMRAEADRIEENASACRNAAESLEKLRDALPPEARPAIDGSITLLRATADLVDETGSTLRSTAERIDADTANVQADRDALEKSLDAAQQGIASAREAFESQVVPALRDLEASVSALESSTRNAADALSNATESALSAAASVDPSLSGAVERIGEASLGLRETATSLRSLAQDINAALEAGDASKIESIFEANVQSLSQAIAAPVEIDRIAVYPAENFGSAMTPLYATLALFIGSLLIMVAIKPSPAAKTLALLEDPKPHQIFLGHFALAAFLSLLQSTVMGLGCLFFLQVQSASPLLFMICFWAAGIVFSFIIYTLVATFANLGKAMAVLLLIVQITGCGGSYPLQLLPSFVQVVSPYLPATHVVSAMRAAMMGTYGNDFWLSIGALALFLIPAAILGLGARRPLSRFMRWFVEHAESSKLIE